MNASQPTDFNVSLGQLLDHSRTEPYCHWGIVCYDGKGCRSFLDPNTEGLSPLTQLLARYPIRSQMAIARLIRCQHRYSLAAAEPFTRECRGQYWSFCYEGTLECVDELPLGRLMPVGTSAAERLFCHLLYRLEQHPTLANNTMGLLQLVDELRPNLSGCSHFLLCNDQQLLVYSRQPVYWQPSHTADTDARHVLVATQPLPTEHAWQTHEAGRPLLFCQGELLTPQDRLS